MWIEGKLKSIYSKIGKSERVAFLCTFIAGMLAHMYIWTNTIPNFDGISRMYEEQQASLVGRWFLHYASYLHGFTQMPMMIGVLAMLLLAVAVLLVVRLFAIKSALLAGLWGVLAAVFPVMAYTNSYTFTASAYCLAILMAVASVYLVRSYRFGWIPGCILLALTMGTYQAYVCMAITLSLLLVIKDMLNGDIPFGKAVKGGFGFVAYIGGGTVLYYITMQVFLKIKDLQLLSYLGMDQVESGYPVHMLGTTLLQTYKQVIDFFLLADADNAFANGWLVFLHVCLLVLTVVFIVMWIHRNRMWKEWLRLAGAAVLLLLLPLAVNFAQVISPYSTPTPIMKYAYVFIYFLAILFADIENQAEGERSESTKQQFICGLSETLLIPVLILSIGYFWKYDNLLYTMLNQAHRATESFVTNVVSRIESCEGYQMGMKVVIVGGFPADRYYADVEGYDAVQQGGALSSSVIPLNKHIYYYMNDWLNVPIPEPAEEDFIRISETETFKNMPLYPNDGSVQIIEECVVVKMQENFTPKAQYEKDYENRR